MTIDMILVICIRSISEESSKVIFVLHIFSSRPRQCGTTWSEKFAVAVLTEHLPVGSIKPRAGLQGLAALGTVVTTEIVIAIT